MFGKVIKDARERKQLSLQEAADLLDMPKTTLWRLESAESRITAQRFVEIIAKYGFDVAEAFEGQHVAAPTMLDYDRLGAVIEYVEEMIQLSESRPTPAKVKTAVVEVLRLETERILETPNAQFDLDRYSNFLKGVVG